jgi:hypothetical protein
MNQLMELVKKMNIFLKGFEIKSIHSVHGQKVLKFLACLVQEKNKCIHIKLLSEHCSGSQASCRTNFRVTGSYRKAGTSSQRLLKELTQPVSETRRNK